MEEKKKCSKCKKSKLLNEFYLNKNSKDGHHHYCKKCHNSHSKQRYDNDPEFREKRKKYGQLKRYNITTDKFLDILNEQKNKCAICDKPFKSKRVTFIDHDHNDGKVRGLLCPKCNTILGLCYDDVEILKSAILYIEKTVS